MTDYLVKHERNFYKIALKKKKLTKEKVTAALRHQKQLCPEKHIAEVFLEQKLLSDQEIIELLGQLFRYDIKKGLEPKEADLSTAEYFLKNQLVTKLQLERCQRQQTEHQKDGTAIPLWQVMISQGVLDVFDVLQYQKKTSVSVDEEPEDDLELIKTQSLKIVAAENTEEELAKALEEEIPKTKKLNRPSRILIKKNLEPDAIVEEIPPQKNTESPYLFCQTCQAAYEKSKLIRGKKYKCKNCGEIFELLSEAMPETLQQQENTQQRELAQKIPRRYSSGTSLTATAPAGEADIFTKYEILGQVAEGAMGIVYKARQLELNRIVALKVLKDTYSSHLGQVKRFKRESESAAALHHPNIVTVYESGAAGDCYYYTMEFIEGEPLMAAIQKRKIPIKKSIGILLEITEGIAYAHSQGMIHRDIKPANILLDLQNHPKITDFGLVKTLTKEQTVLSLQGQAIGTPNYMPPEQAKGDLNEIDARSDVYALGILLYEILTRRVPFSGKSNVEIYRKITEEDPKEPRALNKNCPKELNAICLKAIQKEKSRRYQQASEMAHDLKAYLEDKPIEANTLTIKMQGQFVRMLKRHRPFILLTSAFLISLIGIVIYYQKQVQSKQTQQTSNPPKNTNLQKDPPQNQWLHEALVAWDKFLMEEASAKLETFFQQRNKAKSSEMVKAHLYSGAIDYYQRRYSSSQSHLEQALELDQKSPSPYFYLGALQLKQRAVDASIQTFQQAIALSKNEGKPSPEYYYYQALAYYQKEDYSTAFRNCEEALKIDSSYYMPLCAKGLIDLKMKRYSDAQHNFDRILKNFPQIQIGYLLRSLLDLRNRNERSSQENAFIYLDKIADIQIQLLIPEYAMKEAYYERFFRGPLIDDNVYKNYVQGVTREEFIQLFTEIVEIAIGKKPPDYRVEDKAKGFARLQINTAVFKYYMYRNFTLQKEAFPAIRQELDTLLAYVKRTPFLQDLVNRIAYYKALCFIEENDLPPALDLINEILGRDRYNTTVLILKAWIYVLKQDSVKAEKVYKEIELYGQKVSSALNSKFFFQRGYLSYIKKDSENAHNFFSQAIHENPQNAEAFYYRAKNIIDFGKIEQIPLAIADLKTAAQINPYYYFVFQEIEQLQQRYK
ncbi:MAG: protein kinase [Planctomycetota bacterium]